MDIREYERSMAQGEQRGVRATNDDYGDQPNKLHPEVTSPGDEIVPISDDGRIIDPIPRRVG